MKKQSNEFIALRGKEGDYECHVLPPGFQSEANSTSDVLFDGNRMQESANKLSDINKTFFDSYLSNFKINDNHLLKKAQQNLQEMQEIFVANLSGQ